MELTSVIFHAYLSCKTKAWLLANDIIASTPAYASWFRERNNIYAKEAIALLMSQIGAASTLNPAQGRDLITLNWQFAVDLEARASGLATNLAAVKRATNQSRKGTIHFIPFRFFFSNKLETKDKLLIAFDALILSEVLASEVFKGIIVYGREYVTTTVNIPPLLKKSGR